MNWLDIAIIITSALGALFGLRTGIIRAGFAAAAVIFGMVILGEVTRYAGAWFGDYVEDEAVIKVIGYVMTFVLSVSIAAVSVMGARQCVYTLFLGWTDRLAGLALGLVVAVGFSTAAIVAMIYRANDQVWLQPKVRKRRCGNPHGRSTASRKSWPTPWVNRLWCPHSPP